MKLDELFRNLTGVLRYFATAVVGVCVVALFDRNQDAVPAFVTKAWASPPAWAILGALATLGLVTYALHRVLVHRYVLAPLIRRAIGRDWKHEAELARARWVRRGSNEGTEARSVQNGLDVMNATAHLFYCSAWSALLAWFVVGRTVGDKLDVTAGYWVALVALLGVGIVADVQAARADAEEYARS